MIQSFFFGICSRVSNPLCYVQYILSSSILSCADNNENGVSRDRCWDDETDQQARPGGTHWTPKRKAASQIICMFSYPWGIVDNIIRVWDPESATIETFHIVKVHAIESTHDLHIIGSCWNRDWKFYLSSFICAPSVVMRGSPYLIEMPLSGENLGSFTCIVHTCVRKLGVCEKLWALSSSSCHTKSWQTVISSSYSLVTRENEIRRTSIIQKQL